MALAKTSLLHTRVYHKHSYVDRGTNLRDFDVIELFTDSNAS